MKLVFNMWWWSYHVHSLLVAFASNYFLETVFGLALDFSLNIVIESALNRTRIKLIILC